MTRPKSIQLFERVVLLAILLSIAGTALGLERTVAMVQQFGFGTAFVIGVQAIGVAVMLLLLYFIARRGSIVAKWIFTVIVLLGAINIALNFNVVLAQGVTAGLSIAQLALQLFGIWLLFRSDSAPWFNGSGGEPA